MFNYREERMKQCLRCPVCHEVLQNYGNVLNMSRGKAGDHKAVDELAALLKIKGTNKQKFGVLLSLSKQYKNPEKHFRKNTNCLCSLNRIISSTQPFMIERDPKDCENLFYETFPAGFRVLKEMLELLSCKSKYKYIGAYNFFDDTKCRYLMPYIDGDADDKEPIRGYPEDREKQKEYWINKANLLQNVFDDFCFGSPEGGQLPPYKYCAPQYGYPALENCQSAMFLAIANQLQKQLGSMELDKIPSTYQNIVLKYVEQAPKHFGKTLARVMERQGMIDQDIVYLLDLPRATHLQAWYKSEQPKTLDKYIDKLARCLLVTKEVLISGTGERYGNWKEVLSKEGMDTIKEWMDTIKKEVRADSQDSARVLVRSEIKEWLAMSNEEFEKLMADNPDFFTKETFCVYETEEDGETFTDYPSMVKNLLHPDEFEVLKQVLESQQDQ